jgi:hypothetical protein
MELLFSPCSRLYDILESRGNLGPHTWLQELNLDVSTEELLSAERAFTYADLYAMLGNENSVAWLTPHATVAREGGRRVFGSYSLQMDYRFCFNADGKEIVALALNSEALSKIVEVVRRLLLANAREVSELALWNVGQSDEEFFNAPSLAFSLAFLVEQCQNLKALTLGDLVSLSEDHVLLRGDFSKPGLEIYLNHCRITGAAAAVLAEVLGRNQGPTKLDSCDIDNFVLANGLRGNSRLKSLTLRLSDNWGIAKQELLEIAGALKENKGLVDLDLRHAFTISDETWNAVCDSLKTHPTLQVLNLQSVVLAPIAPAVLNSRIQALVNTMKGNMSIRSIQSQKSSSSATGKLCSNEN